MYSCLTGVQHYYRHTRLQYPKCWCFFWAIIHSQARTFKKRCLCSGEVNTFSCYIYMSVPNSHYHISNMTDNVHNNSLPHKSAWRKSISLFSGSVRNQILSADVERWWSDIVSHEHNICREEKIENPFFMCATWKKLQFRWSFILLTNLI